MDNTIKIENKRHTLWFEYDLTDWHIDLLTGSVERPFSHQQNGMLVMYIEHNTLKLRYVDGNLTATNLNNRVRRFEDLGNNYNPKYRFSSDTIISIIPMYEFEYEIMLKNMKDNVKPEFRFSPILLPTNLPGNIEVVENHWIGKECLWDPANGECDCDRYDGDYYEHVVFERDDYFNDHTKLTPKVEIDLARQSNRLYEIIAPMFNTWENWELYVDDSVETVNESGYKQLYINEKIKTQEEANKFTHKDEIYIGRIGGYLTHEQYSELRAKGYPVYDFLITADINTYYYHYQDELKNKTHRLINIHTI